MLKFGLLTVKYKTVLFQTILFDISTTIFIYIQLNVKAVLTIHFDLFY